MQFFFVKFRVITIMSFGKFKSWLHSVHRQNLGRSLLVTGCKCKKLICRVTKNSAFESRKILFLQ